MLDDDKSIFGLAVKGKWIGCGTKEKWPDVFVNYKKM